MRKKREMNLLEDFDAEVYYRNKDFDLKILRRRLKLQKKRTKEFRLDINLAGNEIRPSLQRFSGKDRFLDSLVFVWKIYPNSLISFQKVKVKSDFCRLIQNDPYSFCLEQSSKIGTEQIQIFFSPADIGNQYLKFETSQKTSFFLRRRFLKIQAVWVWGGRRFPSLEREALIPVRISLEKEESQSFLKKHARKSHQFFPHRIGELATKDIQDNILYSRNTKELLTDTKTFTGLLNTYDTCVKDSILTGVDAKKSLSIMSKKIRSLKNNAGIYFTPFLMNVRNPIAKQRPQLILKKGGLKVYTTFNELPDHSFYVLDITHPDYRQWLKETVRNLVYKWKYLYLRLEGLNAGLAKGDYYESYQSDTSRIRNALSFLRHVVGAHVFLDCTEDFLYSCLGVIDSFPLNNIYQGKEDFDSILQEILNKESIYSNSLPKTFYQFSNVLFDSEMIDEQIQLLSSVLSFSGIGLSLRLNQEPLSSSRQSLLDKTMKLHQLCSKGIHLPLTHVSIGSENTHHFSYSSSSTYMSKRLIHGYYHSAGCLGLWNPEGKAKRIQFHLPPEMENTNLTGYKDYWSGESIPWHVQNQEISIGLGPMESFVVIL